MLNETFSVIFKHRGVGFVFRYWSSFNYIMDSKKMSLQWACGASVVVFITLSAVSAFGNSKRFAVQKVAPNAAWPDFAYIFEVITANNKIFLQAITKIHSCCKNIPCLATKCFLMFEVPYFLTPLKPLSQCLHRASSLLLEAQKWNQTLLGRSWVTSWKSWSSSSNPRIPCKNNIKRSTLLSLLYSRTHYRKPLILVQKLDSPYSTQHFCTKL